jgi:NitT/TauT family transport system substrate-binding protein
MMKKVIIFLLVFMLYGCKPSTNLSIMVPQGSPQLALLGLDHSQYDIEIVLGADPLVAAFGSMSHDAIVAPTNLGAKLYQAKPSYLLAATLVWGNYHLVSTGFTSLSIASLNEKNIIVFGQNQTSDIILKHLLDIYNIDASLTYVDSVAAAASLYIYDPTQIVLVAEPHLSILKQLIPATQSIDCQELYEQYHGRSSYPQASLFVRSNLSNHQILTLLDDVNASILWVNSRTDDVLEAGLDAHLAEDKTVLSNAILGSHLAFERASDAKESCNFYLSIILSFNPQLIGGYLPEDGFYWSDIS